MPELASNEQAVCNYIVRAVRRCLPFGDEIDLVVGVRKVIRFDDGGIDCDFVVAVECNGGQFADVFIPGYTLVAVGVNLEGAVYVSVGAVAEQVCPDLDGGSRGLIEADAFEVDRAHKRVVLDFGNRGRGAECYVSHGRSIETAERTGGGAFSPVSGARRPLLEHLQILHKFCEISPLQTG